MGNEGFDYSDFSDEESVQNSKVKSERSRSRNARNSKVLQGQLTLLQCGFPKLIEKRPETAEHGDCIGTSSDENVGGRPAGQSSKGSSSSGCSLKTESSSHTSGHPKMSVSSGRMAELEAHRKTARWDSPVSLFTEEEKKAGDQHKSTCISNQVATVLETEDSSTENEDIIFPSQVPFGQEAAKSYKNAAVKHEYLHAEESPIRQRHLTSEEKKRSAPSYSKIKPFESMSKLRTLNEASDMSDESDDIEMSKPGKQESTNTVKRKQFDNKQLSHPSRMVLHRNRSGNADSQSIEEFSSPEDNFPMKKTDANRQKLKLKRTGCRIQFKSELPRYSNNPSVTQRKQSSSSSRRSSFSKQTFSCQEQNVGSLDRLLGNYTRIINCFSCFYKLDIKWF